MIKKEYMKPVMRPFELKQRTHLLDASSESENHGVYSKLRGTNNNPQEEIDEVW